MSPQAKHAWPRVAIFARVFLHFAVLFAAAIFQCGSASSRLLNVTRSEAPVDQDESTFTDAISVKTRSRVCRNQQHLALLKPVRGGLVRAYSGIPRIRNPLSGHRLANNLLAPMRC